MDRSEIMGLLPHREPMLLADQIDLEADVAVGQYTVRGTEFFLQGHFPGNPIVPGVMLCEMMGQCACALIGDQLAGATPYFTGMDKVRFRRKVVPGDTIVFHSRMTGRKGNFFFMSGEGRVGDELCVSAELSFAVIPGA
jgi:3-hydroxyacyl-[acyl-carrier-protein] dehydratase